MPQAVLPLLMNTLIASMFVASFLTIAYLNPSTRSTGWFALSYGFGVLEPISHLAEVLGASAAAVRIFAPGTFLIGLALMSPALSFFHGRRRRWRACAAIIVPGLFYYWIMRNARTDWLAHELAYQAFFAASMFLCAFTVWRDAPRSAMNKGLMGVFIVAGLQFLSKPFVASHIGTDGVDSDYATSLYAVFSQASGGVLLVAAGLIILISALQSVVQTNHGQARLDPLTGLPNRRALHEAYQHLNGKPGAATLSIAIIDLDRFKSINDRLGHDRGDEVLRAVAECLQKTCPPTATLARLGGEEFVVLLPDCHGEPARLVCDSIRRSIASLALPGLPGVTASIGLARVRREEDLADALRRADQALYQAKRSGRDRCVVAATAADADPVP